jgi:O-antigen/teichoic acid export membrane protein
MRGEFEFESTTLAGAAVRGSMWSVASSTATILLGTVRAILLARLLLPEHFGMVALALFYIELATRARSLGLEDGFLHRERLDDGFLRTYFTGRLGLDLAVFGLLAATAPLVERSYPALRGWAAVFVVLVAASIVESLSQVQEIGMRRNLRFRNLAAVDLLASLVMTAVAPTLAWRGWGVWALVAEQVSGLGTRFLLSWGPLREWRPRLGWDPEAARWFWRYGRPVWTSANLAYLLDRFGDVWIGTLLGRQTLGFFSRAYEFAQYPRKVVARPLTLVFNSVFARLQDARTPLSQAFYRAAHVVIRTGFLVAGCFALALPEFISVVIGSKWLPLLWTFRALLVYATLDPVLLLVRTLMVAVGETRELERVQLLRLLFFIPAVVLGGLLAGLSGVAVAIDGTVLIGLWGYYRPLRRRVDFALSRLVALPVAAFTLAFGAGLWVELHAAASPAALLAAKVAVFLGLFGGILLLVEQGDYVRGIQAVYRVVAAGRRAAVETAPRVH